MKNFEYAQPRSEREAVELLAESSKQTAVLAGGTDLVGLLKRMVATPDRVVNIQQIDSLRHIQRQEDGSVWVGAAVCLDEFLNDRLVDQCPSAKTVIQGISSIQRQSQGTVVGELLHRPMCWYFRNGHGLLADKGGLVVHGDNRYHAILGNRGPAKFVNSSRLAPALISLGTKVRVIGPDPEEQVLLELGELYRTPVADDDMENVLCPGQLITHLVIPPQGKRLSAAYEVRHGEGPDPPLAAAAVSVDVHQERVQQAQIVLGQVAPVPWEARHASQSLLGKPINEETAAIAGAEAVAGAIALSQNEYKIQLAQVAVKRALLIAVGQQTGGLDGPIIREPSEHLRPQAHLA